MKSIFSIGSVKRGKLHIINRDVFWGSFATKFVEGERVKVTIEKLYKKRSTQQNRYYYGVILPILLSEIIEQGNEYKSEELHEELLKRFAPKKEIRSKEGEFYETTKRSSEMTTSEFLDFTSDVQKWAASFWCCNIPDPCEQTEIF